MKIRLTAALFVLVSSFFSLPAHAQFGGGVVFDPTQSGHAIEQIRQATELYTTAAQTRDQVIATYNLARQMANLPQVLYRQLQAPLTTWTNVSAQNTYGNTAAWVNAVNTGVATAQAYAAATLSAPRFPDYATLDPRSQQIVATATATGDLADGITINNLATLGAIRSSAEARLSDLQQLQNATFSSDTTQHTEMATLQRINAATLMQLRSQQEANQIATATALQQIILQKIQTDALKQSFQDAATYAQGYRSAIGSLTTGFTQTLNQPPKQ
jgi:hypothetical protein